MNRREDDFFRGVQKSASSWRKKMKKRGPLFSKEEREKFLASAKRRREERLSPEKKGERKAQLRRAFAEIFAERAKREDKFYRRKSTLSLSSEEREEFEAWKRRIQDMNEEDFYDMGEEM